MQAKLQEQLSPADAEVILGRLPERIKAALLYAVRKLDPPVLAA
ncbi:hypothetical protein QT995_24505 [Microcoleus sp. S36b_A3]